MARLQWLVALLLLATAFAARPSAKGSALRRPGSFDWDDVYGANAAETRFLRATVVGKNTDTGDEGGERAGLSAPTVDKVKTIFSSSKVTTDQLQKWLHKGKSPDSVLARMRLDKAGDSLFSVDNYEKLTQWLKYVDDFSASKPMTGTSAISILRKQYDDADLYNMIHAALKVPSTKNIATKLQTEQLQHWITVGKSPDDVFQLMKLDKVNENLLSNLDFIAWAKYLDDFNVKNPEKSVSLASTLKQYNNDRALFKMAKAAMTVDDTKNVATKLQDEMVQLWLQSRKTPDDALVELGLGNRYRVEDILEKPLFSTWVKYLDAFNAKYPEKKTTIIETFARKFDDESVAGMLSRRKRKEATRAIATELQAAQLEWWWKSGKSVDDVYKLLRLYPSYGLPNFANNPLLDTWVSYMNFLIQKNPAEATAMFASFTARFKDRPLHQILQAAKKFPGTEDAAIGIQTEKMREYLADRRPPSLVLEILDLDRAGEKLLVNPLFTSWMKYVDDYNTKIPHYRRSWFDRLMEDYKPESIPRMIQIARKNPSTVNIAKRAEKELFKYWMRKKELPKNVLRALDLRKVGGENVLASPEFKAWTTYLHHFNARYPDHKTSMIGALKDNFNNRVVIRMINAGEVDPSTEKIATTLKTALVNKWIADKEPLERLELGLYGVPNSYEILKEFVKKRDALPR